MKNKNNIRIEFLIIAIIITIIFLVSIYFEVKYFSPKEIIPYSGYGISGNKITENLLNSSYEETETEKTVKVEEQEMIFKRWNHFYVGNKENVEINLDYPIYLNDKSALYNLSSTNKLINDKFEEVSSYPRIILLEGKLYNEGDLERVDKNVYLFIKTEENIFINQQKIKIETIDNTYEIPKNSIIYFNEKVISYYTINKDVIKYNKIEDIDLSSKVEIVGNDKYTFEELLIKLEIKNSKKEEKEETAEEYVVEKNEEVKPITEKKVEKIKIVEEAKEEKKEEKAEEVTETEPEEEAKEPTEEGEVYIKPEVQCADFQANVYSANSIITIKDPSRKITSPITFELKKKGKTYLRKSIISSGNFELLGLEPKEKYSITASYTFLNEEEQQVHKNFFSQEIETKGLEDLQPIEIDFQSGDLFSKKIQIKDLKIVSDLRAEALKGLKKIELNINDISYKITKNKINKMLRGESVEQETQENLNSNSEYNYEFKAYDIKGNELKIQNYQGHGKTAKLTPTVSIKTTKQDISEMELSIELKDPDNADIKNYHYVIYDVKGNTIQEANLEKGQKIINLYNLNPSQYYIASIYCDYDIKDGNGIQENKQIGSCNFTTVPLSILGFLHMNIDLKEITSNSAKIEMEINEQKTDSRLIYILKEISVSIFEKDGENESLKETKIIKDEELQQLKNSEKKQEFFENLKSKTNYRIEMKCLLQQGETIQETNVIGTLETFITNKKPAVVYIKNQFVTGNMIDFDIKTVDTDISIINNKVRLELRDEKEKLIKLEYINTNEEDFVRLIFNKLTEKSNYTIKVYADEYNEGNTDTTYKSNYLLKTIEMYTEPGISGSVELTNIERNEKGKNLIDVKSEVKWYSSCFNTWGYYDKTYNEKTKELRLYAGKNGYGQYYVYNLKEYAGQTITFSFLAKLDKHSENMRIYMQNSKTGANRTSMQGITEDDWTRFSYTVTLDKSGYIGIYVVSANDTDEQALLLKEVQAELGSRKTTYEEYKYNVEGKIRIDLLDKRREIEGKDYYIKIEENGEEKTTQNFIEINDDGIVENAIKQYNFVENKRYKISLIIKIRDRFYTISQTEFSTQGEILGINNFDEFLQIQPNGNYIILNDIDFSTKTGYRFGSDKFGVRGTIDFQGHTITRAAKSGGQEGIFYLIERTGKVENMVFNIHLNQDIEYGYYRGVVTTNRGTISNIMVNLKECNNLPNTNFGLIGNGNYGLLENFVINLEEPMYGARVLAAGVLYNYGGTIRNGYIYGKNIEAIHSIGSGQSRCCAGVMYYNDKGIVENIYSLVNVDIVEQNDTTERSASIIETNNRGIVKNIYSVGKGNSTNLSFGPTVGYNQSGKIYNSYYFCDDIFKNNYNLKTTKLALYDKKFQTTMLNSENQFIIEECLSQNYYPHLKMSDKMPNQEFIRLPEVEDRDLVDILSYEIIEDNTDNIKIELSINNPSGEQIKNIQVKDINSRIVSQKYQDGNTILVLELKNPIRYVSSYSIMSISSQGALNLAYTRNYKENERNIFVDFYKKIYSIEDWKEINKSPTENYRLMNDLDFLNCEKEIIITNQYTGKIDGNNHKIKNIRIPKDANNYGLIYNLDGEIKNLYVENFIKENPNNSTYNGFISLAYSKTIIDNVHINNERFVCSIENGTNYTGGLISSGSDLIIRNSSVTGLYVNLGGDLNNARVGGLVGNGSNIRIENSFVQDLDINTKGILIYYGIGGIIGRDGGGIINNCYSTGNITSDAENTGGIYGYSTGTVTHCYSLVNINSETDYIGGIGGYDGNTSTVSTFQNLYLGNLYSNKQSNYINRIQGNTTTEEQNYAYANQKINGFAKSEDLGAEKILTDAEIFDINQYKNLLEFGDEFNYEQLNQRILPKLYNTDGKNILPNQKDNKLEEQEIFIEEVESEKADVNTARARVVVNNPSALEITGVEIKYANIEMTGNVYSGGKTYIDLTVRPERAYDSYTINKLIYKQDEKTKELETLAKLDIQFYNEINSFEDWQKIDSESAQNYRLNTDLDFNGKINPKVNVSIGRLEAEGEGHTLKNLEVNVSGTAKGFIKEAKSTIRNITFENITVNNSARSGNYTGLIVRNIADLDNVKFKDITVNAPKMGYVGSISNNSALLIRNVELENITISGTQHVGGFMGITDSGDFQYINIKNANITATSDYSGSVIGRIVGREPYRVRDITADNITIQGARYTGGIFGEGRTQYLEISNSNISGTHYVGGIVGYMNSNSNNVNVVSRNCTITGTGNYIGGIAGQIYYVTSAFSIDNTITATGASSNGIGGIGGLSYSDLRESGSIRNKIKTSGKNAGGLIGYVSSDEIYFSYSYNCTIEAKENAGGLIGEYRNGYLAYCYTNSDVIANTSSAGGIVGFLNNEDMTGANYTSRIYQDYVGGAKVTAPTQVGGVIGRIVEPLYDSRFYYSNYVEAYLNSNTTSVSIGVGSDRSQNSKINRFYIYEKSTINNQTITPYSENIKSENLLKKEDLSKTQTYTSKIGFTTSYFDFSKLSQGKYPLVKYSGTLVDYQEGIDLPTDTNRTTQLGIGVQSVLLSSKLDVTLPKMNIYSTGANIINVELENTDNNLKLYYTPEGNDTKELNINKKVYSFEYDYKTKVELTLTNGVINKKITIEPENVSNKISLIDNKTYYLRENTIYCEDKNLNEEFVNLYEEKALSKQGKIYNIKEDKWDNRTTKVFELLEEAESIETVIYDNIEIKTFENFTLLKSNIDDTEHEKEGKIVVKDGNLSVIDSSITKTSSKEIINKYNNKEYQTIVGNDNKLHDLKDSITYPKDFVNKDIESIVTENTEKPYVTVQYKSGKVITFDYTTGDIIFDNKEKEDISLIDYMKNAFKLEEIKDNITEENQEEYKKSEELKQTLKQDPIEKGTKDNYITAYDNKNKEYVVYKESEILDMNKQNYESENSKISKNADLTKYYGTQKEKAKNTNGLIWIIPTIIAIITSLVILIRKNRKDQ